MLAAQEAAILFKDNEQKVAIITGAGRNVGEAVARACALNGMRVGVVDANQSRAEAVAASINSSHPAHAVGIVADVTSATAVQSMLDQVLAAFHRVDILVNNVGVVDRKPILELEESEWDRVIDTSLKSVFLCTRAVGRAMVKAGNGGRIVNLGSTTGYVAPNNRTAYPAAKAGVIHLTRAIAVQLAPHNIRVNSVTPNLVASEVDPDEPQRNYPVRNLIGRQCQPQDVANAVMFLLAPGSEFLTGLDILVDGGSMLTR
jgi:NAD(P)-dependent dehydrogenase (short-subunit alcohol dehydrogenase family)